MSAQPEQMYEANDLTHLEGLEAVRKRPGMYIGSTDSRGVNHLALEIIDNAIDEAMAGHADRIDVTLHPDGSVEISDNGRGIPVAVNKKTNLPAVVAVFTLLHFGGKFGGNGYKVSGGLHGVGSSVVNALSRRLDVTVRRDGMEYSASFKDGKQVRYDGQGPDTAATPATGLDEKKAPKARTGTTVRYWHDAGFFLPEATFDVDALVDKMRSTAFLVPGLTLALRDARHGQIDEQTFTFPHGLLDMVEFSAADKPVCDTVTITGQGSYVENAADENGIMQQNVERVCEVEIAFRWGTGYETSVDAFTNVIRNGHGGTHRKGFERGLTRALGDAIKNTRGLLKPKDEAPVLDDFLEGMTAVIHVHVPEPQFTSQTKDELSTAGVTKAVQVLVESHLKAWVNDKKTKAEARTVLGKIVEASRTRSAQKAQKDAARRKTALEGASMPAKLVDCRSNGVERSELFLVEGDSALGSARQGRNSEYQALLPLRGKILNVQKATVADMLKNAECSAIIQVIGAGSGRTFDPDQMRYGRVLLMADADVDGAHIRTLLICLFAKYMRPIIELGRLYAAMPPLHRVSTKGKKPEVVYTYSQAQMEAQVAKFERAGKTVVKPVPRYKGLGEMDADELWATTMDPAARSVRRITLDDVAAAEAMLELLMGDKVEPRRDFIVSNFDRVDADAIDT